MDRAALLFGINDYTNSPPLKGCIKDAQTLTEVLRRHDNERMSRNFDCKTYTSNFYHGMDKAFIMEKLHALFQKDIDVALLFFAGHGTEAEGEGYLLPAHGEGLENYIPFKEIIKLAENSSIDHIFIILDCCFAGAFGNEKPGRAIAHNIAKVREGICILSACDEDEYSAENMGRGLFSELILNGLKGEAADLLGNVTMPSLYAYADQLLNNWQQRPEFKAHIEKRITLRETQARIPIPELLMLPKLFRELDSSFALDPSYEPTYEHANEENVRTFKILQRMRAVYLVEPTEDEHMYFAALNGRSCRMTTLGKFYWRMVKKGMI